MGQNRPAHVMAPCSSYQVDARQYYAVQAVHECSIRAKNGDRSISQLQIDDLNDLRASLQPPRRMEQVPAQNGNVFAAPVRVADNNKLRKVQRDAYAAMVDLFPTYKTLLADICTGAGKSGVACMAPFALCASGVGCKRMVWIVPTIEAREGEP